MNHFLQTLIVRLILAPIAWVCTSLPVLVNSALQVQKPRNMVHSLACSGIKTVNHTCCDYHLKVAACDSDSVCGGPSSRVETTGQPCRVVFSQTREDPRVTLRYVTVQWMHVEDTPSHPHRKITCWGTPDLFSS